MFAEFETYLTKQDRAEGTVRGYIQDLNLFQKWFEADTGEALTAMVVTSMDAIAYRKHLIEERLSAATVNRRLTAIRCWLRWAGNNEVEHVRRVKIGRRLSPKGLDRRQVARILRVAKRSRHPRRNLAIITLMIETGLRVGEVSDLRLADLTINGRSGSVKVVGIAKGLKARVVPLNAGARRALNAWLTERAELGSEHVFISQKGGALSKNAMQRMIGNLARDAGVDDVSAHTLRHTFAKNFLDETKDLIGLAQLLGHTDINTTAIYARSSMADLAEGMERACLTE